MLLSLPLCSRPLPVDSDAIVELPAEDEWPRASSIEESFRILLHAGWYISIRSDIREMAYSLSQAAAPTRDRDLNRLPDMIANICPNPGLF
jgi:hypothetical protein